MNERTTPPPRNAEVDLSERLLQLAGPEPSLDAERRARMEARVRPIWQQTVRHHRIRRVTQRAGWAAAAMLLAALGTALVLREDPLGWRPVASVEVLSGPLEVDGVVTPAGARVRSGQRLDTGGARVALELSDGVSVRVDQRSQLRLLAGRELALERGAVYIDTAGGAGRGLRVLTPFGAVEDIGTRFEVRIESDQLRVRVRDGLVVVRRDEKSWDGRPGEELTLAADAVAHRGAVPSWGAAWEWTLEVSAAGDFDGLPLMDFLDWAARESGTDIHFEDPALMEAANGITVHGDVSGLPLSEALSVVLPVCGLSHDLVQGELRLHSLESESSEGLAR